MPKLVVKWHSIPPLDVEWELAFQQAIVAANNRGLSVVEHAMPDYDSLIDLMICGYTPGSQHAQALRDRLNKMQTHQRAFPAVRICAVACGRWDQEVMTDDVYASLCSDQHTDRRYAARVVEISNFEDQLAQWIEVSARGKAVGLSSVDGNRYSSDALIAQYSGEEGDEWLGKY